MSNSKLDQLRRHTVIVADTGDIHAIEAFSPQDCTTNPSLILRAARMPAYASLVQEAVAWAAKKSSDPAQRLEWAIDRLAVAFGTELSRLVPGFVSTEVDAALSFDTDAMVAKAERLIALYREQGVDTSRILIKIATTWEGVRAAEILEKRGIHCNLTLVFSIVQGVACAEAGAFLISPFVGRILDWYVRSTGKTYTADDDPGVVSVQEIYRYFKAFGYKTVVMGASFRNSGEVLALTGCDRLTVSPAILEELKNATGDVPLRLAPPAPGAAPIDRIAVDETSFRWAMNQDAMATEKLAEGIRGFHADTQTLREFLTPLLQSHAA